ncbi:MAG: cobyric acid synthase [Candidatus Sabulitectum sp.]|nr:cobyric acid synthase [Candidatus Sabulitectum sp.]
MHGGNVKKLAVQAGVNRENILDFSANINPQGPPYRVRSAMLSAMESVTDYPDINSSALVAAIAEKYSLAEECIIPGNGTSELLFATARALSASCSRAVVPVPSYSDYAVAARRAGMSVLELPLHESEEFRLNFCSLKEALNPGDVVFLGHPNNPTGLSLSIKGLTGVIREHPDCIFVVDEAFADYLPAGNSVMGIFIPNLIVLKSLTKFYAIPGLRLGFASASVEICRSISEQLPPWSVNSIAQAAGCEILQDREYELTSRKLNDSRRKLLFRELKSIPGLTVYPGRANFLLVKINESGIDACELKTRLLGEGIAIRSCEDYSGLNSRFFRVAVKNEEDNSILVSALRKALLRAENRGRPRLHRRKKQCMTLMIQGTSSNAGKSIMVTALCRIMLENGLRVAPFKSQNMSLNSYATASGGEMGIAQAIQAQACRLEPDVRMNPILLKPVSGSGCYVIHQGKPLGRMHSSGYDGLKDQIFSAACDSLDSLRDENDIVIIEGAGSPGEVNLKDRDIANMAVARYAEAPVLIVGDIDRGGVFASFVGTMEVLSQWERNHVQGWLINRFRGDPLLLGNALDYTKHRTGKPVLGVVPFIDNLNIPEEDSLGLVAGVNSIHGKPAGECIDIAIIKLPHISNFTDFNPFRIEGDVRLRLVERASDLGVPDAVIIPGSRATGEDLQHLHSSGIAEGISLLAAESRCMIVGICAGFQMLGDRIMDPGMNESSLVNTEGLGLLPVNTTMVGNKMVGLRKVLHLPSGIHVKGYEIHHGVSDNQSIPPLFQDSENGASLGVSSPDGRVWGTYLHGVFDSDLFRRWFIDDLRRSRGLSDSSADIVRYDLEKEISRLASIVRKSIDMNEIDRIIHRSIR